MRKKEVNYWACDFETTVWGDKIEQERGKQQDITEVWSAASTRLYDTTEKVYIQGSIRDFISFISRLPGKNTLYFHNLSFDGSVIVDFLLSEGWQWTNTKDKNMISHEFKTCISDMGDWYSMKLKINKSVIEIRNSWKLMPKALKAIGKSFRTKHQKLEMEYEGERYAYCDISDEEKEYIKNDVLLLKEALEMMFSEGHDKLTIGSCCLSEYKTIIGKKDYEKMFPDLRDFPLDERYAGVSNLWDYIHNAYHGGWCYVNPRYAHKIVSLGKVYDVNSLYPSMMHSESGNRYPYAAGDYHTGKPPENFWEDEEKFYYVRFSCRFELKEKVFPWVHIRNTAKYKGNENLYTSDIRHKGKYYRYYYDKEANICDTTTILTMTWSDYVLFRETYNVYNFEWKDYVVFWARVGLFDDYINPYAELKKTSKGFRRELSKLFLNNLYGKFASSDNSSYKEPYLGDDGIVHFKEHEEHEKDVGYIACGAAITSYALNFTVRHAIANYDRFCYADTDSIHIQGLEPANMVVEHPSNFCCWKNEIDFSHAYYERQKLYAEKVIAEEGEPVDTPYLLIKAAGMSAGAKQMFIDSGRPISDLSTGLELESCNLKATRIKGGILLRNKTYKIRKPIDKHIKPVV